MSLSETKFQLYLAMDRYYIDQKGFDAAYDLCDKTARQLFKFIDYLEKNRFTPTIERVTVPGY